MASKLPAKFIDPEQVLTLAPALRSITVLNFVKFFLQVIPLAQPIKLGDGKRGAFFRNFVGRGEDHVVRPVREGKPPLFAFHKTYDIQLPLYPVECLQRLSESIRAFEWEIDRSFLQTLSTVLPPHHVIELEDFSEAAQAARAALENDHYPAEGLYVHSRDTNKYGFARWLAPPMEWWSLEGYGIAVSDKSRTGVMQTSPLDIDIRVEIPMVKLTLGKRLAFVVDPHAFAECRLKSKGGT